MHYTIHLFQVYNYWFVVYSQSCAAITTVNFRSILSSQRENLSPSAVTPQALTTMNLLFVSMDLPVLDLSYKWNRIACGLLYVCHSVSWRRQWHPIPVLLPGKSHGRRSLVACRPWGREESDLTERLHFHFSLLCIGEGNGNPLQHSCLENPRDGVAQSRTRLKWLSSSIQLAWCSQGAPCWWNLCHYFVWLSEIPLYRWAPFCLSINLVDILIVLVIHLLWIMLQQTLHIFGVELFSLLLGIYPGVELLGQRVTLCLIFWGASGTAMYEVSNFPPFSPTLLVLYLFDYNHYKENEVVSCGTSLTASERRYLFHVLLAHLYIFFVFLLFEFRSSLYILDQVYDFQIFHLMPCLSRSWWCPLYHKIFNFDHLFFNLLAVLLVSYLRNRCLIQGHKDSHLYFLLRLTILTLWVF